MLLAGPLGRAVSQKAAASSRDVGAQRMQNTLTPGPKSSRGPGLQQALELSKATEDICRLAVQHCWGTHRPSVRFHSCMQVAEAAHEDTSQRPSGDTASAASLKCSGGIGSELQPFPPLVTCTQRQLNGTGNWCALSATRPHLDLARWRGEAERVQLEHRLCVSAVLLQNDELVQGGLRGRDARRRPLLAGAAGWQRPLAHAVTPGVQPHDFSVRRAAWEEAQAEVLVHSVLQRCLHGQPKGSAVLRASTEAR